MENIYKELDELFKNKKKNLIIGILFLLICLGVTAFLSFCIMTSSIAVLDNKAITIPLIVVTSLISLFLLVFSIRVGYTVTTIKANSIIFDYIAKSEFSEFTSVTKKDAYAYNKLAFNDKYNLPYGHTLAVKIPFGMFMQCPFCSYVSNGNSSTYKPLIKGLVFIFEIKTFYEMSYMNAPHANCFYKFGTRKEIKEKTERLLIKKDELNVERIKEIVVKLNEKFASPFAFKCTNDYVMVTYEAENYFNYKDRKSMMELQEKFNELVEKINELREYFEELFI